MSLDLQPSPDDDLLSSTNPDDIKIEDDYKGLSLNFPLDAQQLPEILDYFREKKMLHAKYALQILHETRKLLKGMASWNQVC